jgi:predicted neuraminidase
MPAAPTFLIVPPPPARPMTPRLAVVAETSHGVVHAPSALEQPDGSIRAFWFEGAVEAGRDVRIRTAALAGGAWSGHGDVADAVSTGEDLGVGVRTIGNPVVFAHPSDGYWMVHPTVTLGGWAGSSLALRRSRDGRVFGPARRLWSSVFLNLSTLAKAPGVALSDGSVALPAYHEMIGGFGELLFIDPAGRVRDKARMGARGLSAIQPWMLATGERTAFALCRDLSKRARRIWRTETADAGLSWSPAAPIELPNPNSAIALTALEGGRAGLVFNDHETDRTILRLAVTSDDGRSFRRGPRLLPGEAGTLRYPFLLAGRDGALHLLVSQRRREDWRILHLAFGRDAFDLGDDDAVG